MKKYCVYFEISKNTKKGMNYLLKKIGKYYTLVKKKENCRGGVFTTVFVTSTRFINLDNYIIQRLCQNKSRIFSTFY